MAIVRRRHPTWENYRFGLRMFTSLRKLLLRIAAVVLVTVIMAYVCRAGSVVVQDAFDAYRRTHALDRFDPVVVLPAAISLGGLMVLTAALVRSLLDHWRIWPLLLFWTGLIWFWITLPHAWEWLAKQLNALIPALQSQGRTRSGIPVFQDDLMWSLAAAVLLTLPTLVGFGLGDLALRARKHWRSRRFARRHAKLRALRIR